MPFFHYTALDDTGRKLRGQMEAASESALELLLQRRGHWLTEVREKVQATVRISKRAGIGPSHGVY